MPSSLVLIFGLLGVVIFCPTIKGLRCHNCGGSDYVPKPVLKALLKLNIANVTQYGDCKTTATFCEDGQFCVKNTVSYKIGFKGLRYTWNTYTKGCVSPQNNDPNAAISNASTGQRPMQSGACYTDPGKNGSSTITTTTSVCYCSDRDFCNSAVALGLTPVLLAFLLLSILF